MNSIGHYARSTYSISLIEDSLQDGYGSYRLCSHSGMTYSALASPVRNWTSEALWGYDGYRETTGIADQEILTPRNSQRNLFLIPIPYAS